ncbi:MAG: 30S ribosomal protein S6 [Candidatus Dormibacteria bacterium]
MLREYELFYIVRPDVDEEQVRTAMDEVASMVAGHGGEVTKSSLWGRRRLAYTIAGFTDGYYALKEISLPGEKLRELERQLILDERVIRQMITLRQVYYLPEGEDRRGRARTRSKDRAAARAEGIAPEEVLAGDVSEEEPTVELAEFDEAAESEVDAGDVGGELAADEGSGEG